jgi:hypothetical protein
MDSLITALVLLVVSALATWMKKKAADGRGDSPSDSPQTPPTNQPRPSPRPTSWEEELRRLLEGQSTPKPPPPMRPPTMRPAPPVVATRPQSAPPAPPMVIKPVLVPPERRAVVPMSSPAPTPLPVPPGVQVSAAQLAPMNQSREAYERASQLDKNVAAHIDRVPGQRVLATSVVRRNIPPEITQVVSLFKSARTARQAVIASLILGPPRASEEISPGW